jgi:hypothetical protein
MQIIVEEIKNDCLLEEGLYIDVIFTPTEIDNLMNGETIEGSAPLKKRKIYLGAGLKGFYGEENRK